MGLSVFFAREFARSAVEFCYRLSWIYFVDRSRSLPSSANVRPGAPAQAVSPSPAFQSSARLGFAPVNHVYDLVRQLALTNVANLECQFRSGQESQNLRGHGLA